MIPFVTLYHWDLPQALEKEGGWASHLLVKWFSRFVTVCAEEFGGTVKNWIVLNEPMGFTSLGYLIGKHAPGKTNVSLFLSSVHNACLAQAEGGRILRLLVKNAYIGTSFSCSEVKPFSQKETDLQAANRVDILLNRLFVEPSLGMNYPHDDFPLMDKLHLQVKAWKFTERMHFDFDFIGVQNYFPVTVKYNGIIPYVQATEVKASTRKVATTAMGWEINADSFYNILAKFNAYKGIRSIIVSENGAYFKDELKNGVVNDIQRIHYFQQYLKAMLKAKRNGMKINGYFAWTLTDNFEWAEGFKARFGLVHIDFETQLRTIKNSGYWWRDFLKD
jgi:beta-glucosidase